MQHWTPDALLTLPSPSIDFAHKAEQCYIRAGPITLLYGSHWTASEPLSSDTCLPSSTGLEVQPTPKSLTHIAPHNNKRRKILVLFCRSPALFYYIHSPIEGFVLPIRNPFVLLYMCLNQEFDTEIVSFYW